MENHQAIRIVSINTGKNQGDYFKRLQALSRQLRDYDPHIIACQECFSHATEDISTLDFLARELNMNSVFTPARFKKRLFNSTPTDSYSGVGIITSLSIDGVRAIDLPADPNDGERKAQIVNLRSQDGASIKVANFQLTHLPNNALRRLQLLCVAETMLEGDEELKIFCGDFNAESSSQELLAFKQAVPVKDCFEHNNRYPKNTHQTPRKVDHMFYLPHNPAGVVVHNSFYILDDIDEHHHVYPSGHPGLLIKLQIKQPGDPVSLEHFAHH